VHQRILFQIDISDVSTRILKRSGRNEIPRYFDRKYVHQCIFFQISISDVSTRMLKRCSRNEIPRYLVSDDSVGPGCAKT